MTKKYKQRTYRNLVQAKRLKKFEVIVKETDLLVHAREDLTELTRELILRHRGVIEAYIQNFPEFHETLGPWQIKGPAPNLIMDMARAGRNAGVGPMAAVAGALAEYVGKDLMDHSPEAIVENGGDIFIKSDTQTIFTIYAGSSPLSMKTGIKVARRPASFAMCTSSGTVGHSKSFGKADAVSALVDGGDGRSL